MLTFSEYQELLEYHKGYHDWSTTRKKPERNYKGIQRVVRSTLATAALAALAGGAMHLARTPVQKVSYASPTRQVVPLTDAQRQSAFDLYTKQMTPEERHADALKRQQPSDVHEVDDDQPSKPVNQVKPAPAAKPKQPVKPVVPAKPKQPVKRKK